MPPPPMVPGKHNMDIGTWDTPAKNPPVPSPIPAPVITGPPPQAQSPLSQQQQQNNPLPGPIVHQSKSQQQQQQNMNQLSSQQQHQQHHPQQTRQQHPNAGGHMNARPDWPVPGAGGRGDHPNHNNMMHHPPPHHMGQNKSNIHHGGGHGPPPHMMGHGGYHNPPPPHGHYQNQQQHHPQHPHQHHQQQQHHNQHNQPPPPPPPSVQQQQQQPPPQQQQQMPLQQPQNQPRMLQSPTLSNCSSTGSHPVLEVLRDKNNYNPPEFDYDLVTNARFFVIKSYSEDDIHRSIKYEIWCSTEHGNNRLDQAYRERERENGSIYLFYSVNGSGHFCGVAQMISAVDYNSNSSVWAQNKWKGVFKVRWIYVKDVPNQQLRSITLENNENKAVTHSRDAQEVPNAKGKQVLKIIHEYKHTTSIFDDFSHYEERQEKEDSKKHVPSSGGGGGSSGGSNGETGTRSMGRPPLGGGDRPHSNNSSFDKMNHPGSGNGFDKYGGGGGYNKSYGKIKYQYYLCWLINFHSILIQSPISNSQFL